MATLKPDSEWLYQTIRHLEAFGRLAPWATWRSTKIVRKFKKSRPENDSEQKRKVNNKTLYSLLIQSQKNPEDSPSSKMKSSGSEKSLFKSAQCREKAYNLFAPV